MLPTILLIYLFIGIGVAVWSALEVGIHNKRDAGLAISIVPLWPLWITLACAFAIYDWRLEKNRDAKHRKVHFLRAICRMKLVSQSTIFDILDNF